MERETIYVQGHRATAAALSPRLISSGGSEAGIETPITITSGGSRSGHMVDSKGPMQELIPLGRSTAANSKDFVRLGELQADTIRNSRFWMHFTEMWDVEADVHEFLQKRAD